MSNEARISIKCLFDSQRIQSQYDLIPIIFYFPFGICLMVIRFFIGLHVFIIANIIPKTSLFRCLIMRTLCAILGIIVREENVERKRKGNANIIIANHITNIDHLAIDLVLPCLLPLTPEVIKNLPLSKLFYWTLGYYDFNSFENRELFLRSIDKYLTSISATNDQTSLPLLIQPECTTTNGKIGMLKFVNWPFNLGCPVQPVCISISRPPPIKLTPTSINSSWWSDLFWILFTPITFFNLKYLEPTKIREEERSDEFAKRVQIEMCNAIGLKVTNYSDTDKYEYIKRLRHSENSSAMSFSSSVNQQTAQTSSSTLDGENSNKSNSKRTSSAVEIMATRVQEVLPQVPIDVIRKDLLITTNIDETITRLIDGTIVYEPIKFSAKTNNSKLEPLPSSSSASSSPSSISNQRSLNQISEQIQDEKKLSFNTAAKNFGKTANERMSSYHERKQALIEAARLRYLKKHPDLLKDLQFK